MKIKFNLRTHKFAVVAHYVSDGRLLYIGAVRYSHLLDVSIADTSIKWREEVAKSHGEIEVEVMQHFDNRTAAMRYAMEKRIELKPITWDFPVRRRKVKCVENGKEYRSAAEAAADNGISRGAMSSHLNGYKNYGSIHGLHFEWIDIVPDVNYDAIRGGGTALFPDLAETWAKRTGKTLPAPSAPVPPPPVPPMPFMPAYTPPPPRAMPVMPPMQHTFGFKVATTPEEIAAVNAAERVKQLAFLATLNAKKDDE